MSDVIQHIQHIFETYNNMLVKIITSHEIRRKNSYDVFTFHGRFVVSKNRKMHGNIDSNVIFGHDWGKLYHPFLPFNVHVTDRLLVGCVRRGGAPVHIFRSLYSELIVNTIEDP